MGHHSRFSELDRRFSVERDLLERMLFKLVVVRAMRLASVDPSDLWEAHRQFESAAAGIRLTGRAASPLDDHSDGAPLQDGLETLAMTAPEPYRTMFVDHLARVTGIAAELGDPSHRHASTDPLDRRLEEVLCHAVRGRVSGNVASELASFVRSGMREQAPDGA